MPPAEAFEGILPEEDAQEEESALSYDSLIDLALSHRLHKEKTSTPAPSSRGDDSEDGLSGDELNVCLSPEESPEVQGVEVELADSPPPTPSSSAAPKSQANAPPHTAQDMDIVAEAIRSAEVPALDVENPPLPRQEETPPVVPEDLRDLFSFECSSAPSTLEKVDWRLAEEPLVYPEVTPKGKVWVFRCGPGNFCLKADASIFLEKIVSGKTLIALSSKAPKWHHLELAFMKLKLPAEPGLMDAEMRRMRKSILTNFLAEKDSSYARALGNWRMSEDGNRIIMSELPMMMREVVEGKRQAQKSSPPHSVQFDGEPGSEAEAFHAAINSSAADFKAYLGWGDYLDANRLPEPGSTSTLEHLRKDLAGSSRALQCSLASVSLARHVAELKPEVLPNQAKLRELVDVLGVLSTESALSILPDFDRQTQLFKAEKKALRERVLKNIKPPSTSIALMNAPLLSAGLFPEKEFKEVDVKAREVDALSYFPQLKASGEKLSKEPKRVPPFKRPLSPGSLDNATRKKTRPYLPSFPSKQRYAWRGGQSHSAGQSFSGQGSSWKGRQSTFPSSQSNRGKHPKFGAGMQPPAQPNASQGKKRQGPSSSKPSKSAGQQPQSRK